MFCKYCGKELLDSDKFCPFCGNAVATNNSKNGQNPNQSQNQSQNQYQNYSQNSFRKFEDQPNYNNVPYYVNQQPAQNPDDSGSVGWGFLGFFIPICGLILFIVWNKSKPKNAKNAGIGALVSVCLYVVFFILFVFFLASIIRF